MNKNILKALLIGGLLLSETPYFGINPVQACACCADRNTWARENRKPEQYELDVINALNFAKGSFFNVGEFDETIFNERGLIVKAIKSKSWQFSITKKSPQSGISTTVNFVPSSNKWQFARIDTGDSKDNYNVVLYHEIVITGTLNINNDPEKLFKGVKKIPAQLILQAKSNNCLSQESFYQWILQFKSGELPINANGKMSGN